MDDDDEFDEWQQAQPVADTHQPILQTIDQHYQQKGLTEIHGVNQHSTADQGSSGLAPKQEETNKVDENKGQEEESFSRQRQDGVAQGVRSEWQTERPALDDKTQSNQAQMDFGSGGAQNYEGFQQKQSNSNIDNQNHLDVSSHNSQNNNDSEGLRLDEANLNIKMLSEPMPQLVQQKAQTLGDVQIQNESQQKEDWLEQQIVEKSPNNINFSQDNKQVGVQRQQQEGEPVEEQNQNQEKGIIEKQLHSQNNLPDEGNNDDEDEFGDYQEQNNVVEAPMAVGPPTIASSQSLVSCQKQTDPQANSKAMDFISRLPNYSFINASYFVEL